MNDLTYPRFGTNSSRYPARLLIGEKLKHRDADTARAIINFSPAALRMMTKTPLYP